MTASKRYLLARCLLEQTPEATNSLTTTKQHEGHAFYLETGVERCGASMY